MTKLNNVAYINKNDSFSDVLQKFVFSKGQALFLNETGELMGLITINDIMDYLL